MSTDTTSADAPTTTAELRPLLDQAPDAELGPYRLVGDYLLFVKEGEVAGAVPVRGLKVGHTSGRSLLIPVAMGVLVMFTATCGFGPMLAYGEFVAGPSACCMLMTPLFLIGLGLTLWRWKDVTVRQWLVMTTAEGTEGRWRLPPDAELHDIADFMAKVRVAAERPPPAPADVPEGKAWVLQDAAVELDADAPFVEWTRSDEESLAEARRVWGRVGDAQLDDPVYRPDILGLAYYGNRLVRVSQVDLADRDAVRDWLGEQRVVVLVPGPSALDHALRIILSASGEPHDPESTPPSNTEAIRRRRHTVRRLSELGYPVIGAQPYEEEVRLRSPEEVARRALCLGLIVGPLGAGASQGAPIPGLDALPPPIQPFVDDLSPDERSFLQAPDAQTGSQLQWRMESALTLLWALGLVDGELSMTEQTDGEAVIAAGEALGVLGPEAAGLQPPEALRDLDEILDLLDEVYCRHWVSVDDRVNRRDASARPHHPAIIYERLYALCWLTGFLNDEDMTWDTVQTPT